MTAGLDHLTDDYSRKAVPVGESVSGFRVALVIIGFAITLPLMITGSRVGLSLGLREALTAFVAGGLVLVVIGAATAVVAANARLSTYKILEFSFGQHGAKAVSAVLAMTLFGWYGVTAALFGQALHTASLDAYGLSVSPIAGTLVGSLLMIAVTVFGFRALDRLSLLAVPVLVVFLVWVVLRSVGGAASGFEITGDAGEFGVSISIVVGTYIVGAVLVPDLCRYVTSARQGVFAIVLSLGIGLPFILGASAIPSLATGEPDLVDIMVKLGLGMPALIVIVFATWTSNANNLYSTSLGLAAVFDRWAKWKLTVGAGIAGSLVAIGGITDYFIPFLLVLGVAIPPVAGIYLGDYFVVQGRGAYTGRGSAQLRKVNATAFVTWAIATGIGAATAEGWIALTRIPACDSFLLAGVLYCGASRALSRWHVKRSNT